MWSRRRQTTPAPTAWMMLFSKRTTRRFWALGGAYGAQMLRRMEQDVDVWGAAAKGDLTPITAWLREKVHQYGGLMEPADVVKNACGDFSAEDYIQYLTRKYTELYGL